jgi:arylsulfatase A-like enzyme
MSAMKRRYLLPSRPRRSRVAIAVSLALAAGVARAESPDSRTGATAGPGPTPRPNVLILTIDALRADRLSCYGYGRPTSPAIDRLLARGVRFTDARTIEPLTAPSLVSMLTSLPPDVHGASRNAVQMRRGIESLGTILERHGYDTAAFVANWTLRHQLTGLDRHFEVYREVLTRRRWFHMIGEEADAADLDAAVTKWIGRLGPRTPASKPLLLWVHYVDPHAPYRMRYEYAARIGLPRQWAAAADRYDTEIAAADDALGQLVDELTSPAALGPDTLIVFAADHGESLGEHDYWGHGRNLYEPTVRIPLGFVWPGHLPRRVVDAPATILDVTPTILGLLGVGHDEQMAGFDWTPVFAGAPAPQRVVWMQAHEGAAIAKRSDRAARRRGLLEVGEVDHGVKRIWRIADGKLLRFDLASDPGELRNLAAKRGKGPPGPDEIAADRELKGYLAEVQHRLDALGPPTNHLDPESIAKLKALGYLP